jgi:hypothetical protein
MKQKTNIVLVLLIGFVLPSCSFSPTPFRSGTLRKPQQCFDTTTLKSNQASSKDSSLFYNPNEDPDQRDVNVNLIGDVDSVTLTAIGFGLIALNFFVFANMGDGGIGGIVARIINTFN